MLMTKQQNTQCRIYVPSPKLEKEYSLCDRGSAAASITIFRSVYIFPVTKLVCITLRKKLSLEQKKQLSFTDWKKAPQSSTKTAQDHLGHHLFYNQFLL